MTETRDLLRAAADAVLEGILIAKGSIKKELVDQGHVLTGRLRDSIREEVSWDDRQAQAILWAEDYAVIVNIGLDKSKVRYPISVMIEYFRKRGLPIKEAKRAAYATRNVHQREGMPTKASSRFSKNGYRRGFVQRGLDPVMKSISEAFEKRMGYEVEIIFNKVVQKIEPLEIGL